jgi:glycosyltransferase involved in cell wall biosynthesis
MEYILISSAYNEESNIKQTLESVIKQTKKPVLWLIVNDGSKDNTGKIIEEYTKKHNWIIKIDKKNDNIGIYNFIGHLDADIILDRADYYEYQINKMRDDPTLGICSGVTYHINNKQKKILCKSHKWHTVGGLKFYRRKCFEAISPIPADIGWDGIDEFKAMYRGWKTEKFFELEVNHLGALRDFERNLNSNHYFYYGKSTFRRGRPIWFAILKSLKAVKTRSISCGMLFIKGYFFALINAEIKFHTKEEMKFVNSFDRKRLLNKNYPFET